MDDKKIIDEIMVYTDGSLSRKKEKDGNITVYCGYGILYPNGELPNVSRIFKNGEPTNNRAELQAIYVALIQIGKKYIYNKIKIYSDSKYCIQSLTEYITKWVKNGWMTSQNKPVENQDIIKPIYNIMRKQKDKIEFVHVKAHTKNTDDMTKYNAQVDKLAKLGSKKIFIDLL